MTTVRALMAFSLLACPAVVRPSERGALAGSDARWPVWASHAPVSGIPRVRAHDYDVFNRRAFRCQEDSSCLISPSLTLIAQLR